MLILGAMMEHKGKRILHGILGFIVGFGIGAFADTRFKFENFWLSGIIGAVICGFGAFFMLDEFWDSIGGYFRRY